MKHDLRVLVILIVVVISFVCCAIIGFTVMESPPTYKHFIPTRTSTPMASPVVTPRPPCVPIEGAQCFGVND